MPRSKSSKRWLKEHFTDPFVKRAKEEGARSRAVYKLEAIDKKDKLLKPGQVVVDLGAAPGAWSVYAAARVGERGRVVALDLLEMAPLPGVTFIQGDFLCPDTYQTLLDTLSGQPVDVVLSDMAPNTTGTIDVDQPRAMYLSECALTFAEAVLKPGGTFLIKVFQGEGFEAFLKAMRARFAKVMVRKPEASRARSRENYLLGVEFRPSSAQPGSEL